MNEPTAQILHGSNLDMLPTIADASIDAIVTDPPYELGFMGKKWDASGIAYNVDLWRECLRVLKPGGYLLAFGGTRTYHRMAVAIEDAGFEIRDSIHWLYGSGFPKSLDVSKAIDKAAGAERERVPYTGGIASGSNNYGGGGTVHSGTKVGPAPATDAAREWSGWGTALKPAHEPIVVARKPLDGTVAANVLQHGTGALNIDGCRVPGALDGDPQRFARTDGGSFNSFTTPPVVRSDGRWPANVILIHAVDCGDTCAGGCPVAELDRQSGVSKSKPGRIGPMGGSRDGLGMGRGGDAVGSWPADPGGGASRFFTVTELDETADIVPFRYVPKPSKRERNAGLDGNHHPTVKPIALMRWLVRLVTPPDGTVLDPFAGSGTTLAAAILENVNSIGIELTDEYLPIIEGRIQWAHQQTQNNQPTLFDT